MRTYTVTTDRNRLHYLHIENALGAISATRFVNSSAGRPTRVSLTSRTDLAHLTACADYFA